MKYHIDTIPVWDAYKAGHDCPLCALHDDNEAQLVDLFLGESVMEPDRRVEVNDKGFCARHLEMLFVAGNRLGLALMCHTHLKETIARYKAAGGQPSKAGRGAFAGIKRMLGGQTAQTPWDAARGEEADGASGPSTLAALTARCAFCDRIEYTMGRYLYTLIHLWRSDVEFRAKLSASRGLCMPHYSALMDMAAKELSGSAYEKFEAEMRDVQTRDLEKLEKDIEWFTLKFDYRNQDKPWGDSKDAVERVINKLRGKRVSGD